MRPLLIKNPHSLSAALKARPGDVVEIFTGKSPNAYWKEVISLAKKAGVSVKPAKEGSGAKIKEKQPVSLESLAPDQGTVVVLDCITDPHNIGAIFRTAGFLGAQAIVMTQDRSSPMSGTVYDVASGGVEAIPHVLVKNLAQALKVLKESGFWILGTSEHATETLSSVDRSTPWVVVFGNEESGMRRLTKENCDFLCQIPSKGKVDSLNVSVTAGIVLSTLIS